MSENEKEVKPVLPQIKFLVEDMRIEAWIETFDEIINSMGFEKIFYAGTPIDGSLVFEYSKDDEKIMFFQPSDNINEVTIAGKIETLEDIMVIFATKMGIKAIMNVFEKTLSKEFVEKLKSKLEHRLGRLLKETVDEAKIESHE